MNSLFSSRIGSAYEQRPTLLMRASIRFKLLTPSKRDINPTASLDTPPSDRKCVHVLLGKFGDPGADVGIISTNPILFKLSQGPLGPCPSSRPGRSRG